VVRPSKTDYFLALAFAVATRSTCLRKHHGAVIVKDGAILGTGYNGSAASLPHCTDTGCNREGAAPGTMYEACVSVHAELNALLQAARHGTAVAGATLYVTGQPCIMCARAIVNAGIGEVTFVKDGRYQDSTSTDLLAAAGCIVTIA
jgi:dCMP deaminase